MSDSISRQAAIDIVEFECGEWRGLARTIVKAIEQLPSAQPQTEWNNHTVAIDRLRNDPDAEWAEIIRCKDCRWHNGEINQCNAQICASMYGEDFCSRGERRTEND